MRMMVYYQNGLVMLNGALSPMQRFDVAGSECHAQ